MHSLLKVETICGNILLVGVGAHDDPFLRSEYKVGSRKIIACMWSGIITCRSIFTPDMLLLDNKYFSAVFPVEVNCICGSSWAPTPTESAITERICFLSFVHIVMKYAPLEL